ncbi:ROK family transcriptional regulator [Brachybacterium sp. YJGR34]|uniref:ROK family transcriptional regulator n=1 Tax=Brachybacterium sp. YJGR34 TaxID=2059911 RepID=UPI000E0B9C6B|nr:ROK family transcriptional regulator [Brachybacterium sp. YJGR34]
MQGDKGAVTVTAADGARAERDLGSESMRAVYRDLLRFGPRSRSELTARLGLSAPTVTRVTRELIEAGRLHPLEVLASTKGRPQEPLDIEENDGPRFIGVKVTAEEIHAVVTTVRGNALEELTLPLRGTAPEVVLEAVSTLALTLAEAHPHVVGVGVSLGGRVDSRRTVVGSTLLGWTRPQEIAARLEERTRLPVVVENDLLAMIAGLHWFGLGRAYRSFAVLTVGAGVALGTVFDDRVITGRTHLAGITEAMPVGARPDGTPLPVGEVARTENLLRRAREDGVLADGEGLPRLRELLAAEDPAACRIAGDLARALARAAAAVVALLDPEAVVVGGETLDVVRAAGGTFEDTLRGAVAPAQRDLVVRELGGDFDEWARGAAVIAIQDFVGAPA